MRLVSAVLWDMDTMRDNSRALRSGPFVVASVLFGVAAALAVAGGVAESVESSVAKVILILVISGLSVAYVWRAASQRVVVNRGGVNWHRIINTVRVSWADVEAVESDRYSGWLNRGGQSALFEMPVIILSSGRRLELTCLMARKRRVCERVKALRAAWFMSTGD